MRLGIRLKIGHFVKIILVKDITATTSQVWQLLPCKHWEGILRLSSAATLTGKRQGGNTLNWIKKNINFTETPRDSITLEKEYYLYSNDHKCC